MKLGAQKSSGSDLVVGGGGSHTEWTKKYDFFKTEGILTTATEGIFVLESKPETIKLLPSECANETVKVSFLSYNTSKGSALQLWILMHKTSPDAHFGSANI